VGVKGGAHKIGSGDRAPARAAEDLLLAGNGLSKLRASGAAPSFIGERRSEAGQSRAPNDSGGKLPQPRPTDRSRASLLIGWYKE